MVDFRALETFLWVVTLRSFGGAATKLNTTQPAISQRIAALERDIGQQLINRTGRTFTPTATGRRLLEHAERLIRARAEMMLELADPASLRGSLSLGASETIVHTWLPTFLERMAKTYPNLDIEIDVDISENLRERLLVQDIDLAFMLGPSVSPHLSTSTLNRYPLALIAAKGLFSQNPTPALSELLRYPILTFARNSMPYVAIREIFMRPSLPRARIRAVSSLATIVRMSLDGLGIAIIPPAIVRQEIRDDRLAALPLPFDLPELEFVAAWRSGPDSVLPQAAARLAAEIAAE